MQWNARSAISNKNNLIKFLNEQNIHVALISETWFKPSQRVNFPGFNVIRRDRIDGKAGVAILVKKQFRFKEINFDGNMYNEDILVCGITLEINQSYISFVSLYRPPNINTLNNDWRNIFMQCSHPLIIGGDFNAHSNLWGSAKNDQVGRQLINCIEEIDLVILNNGDSTRLTSPNINKSVVDITLATSALASQMNWNVYSDSLGSDHFPILIQYFINLNFDNIVYPKSKWNTNKANWELYESLLEHSFQYPPQGMTTLDKYNYFIENINMAAERSIPTFKPFKVKNRPPPPWWDEECDQIIQRRKDALITYKQNSTIQNFIACKNLMALSKKKFKYKARENWKQYCGSLNGFTPSKVLWLQAKKLNRIPVNNIIFPSSEVWLDEFFNHVAPPSVVFHDETIINSCPTEGNFFSQPLTMAELSLAI